jgi:ribosomal protein S18 acetylase RimI-like enzyme
VEPNENDRRIRIARLTRKGIAERGVLDQRSDEFASSLLEPLTEAEQRDLVAAMRRVERLLTAGALDLRVTDPEHPDARRCIGAYFAELDRRSPTGFDPAASVSVDPDEVRPPAGVLLVAYLHDEAVGCGALRGHADGRSEIKRMWVAESARGLGIARRMLEALEARAREAGARATCLDTNRNLTEAIAMYRSAGYVEVDRFTDEPFADHWFEKEL